MLKKAQVHQAHHFCRMEGCQKAYFMVSWQSANEHEATQGPQPSQLSTRGSG